MRKPDPLIQGLSETMGWTKSQAAGDPSHFGCLQAISLDDLAGAVKWKLGIRGGMRVVGDPDAEIRTIGLLPGTTPLAAALKMLPDVDAIVAGEVREWESVEYAQDTVAAGMKKGLILHRTDDVRRAWHEAVRLVAERHWFRRRSVEWIGTGDPYWRLV